MTHLSNITDIYYTENIKKISSKIEERKDKLIEEFHPCSDEYLFKAFELNLKDFGYPRAALGANQAHLIHMLGQNNSFTKINALVSRLGNFLGTPVNALTMYYPENGYIGWHHNGNAPGYNILMTYSLDGEGGFSFWDYKTKSIVTIPDKIGWSVKVGYYPSEKKESDRIYWHMAKTKSPRVSVAYIINHKDMWKNMIDEISQGDYDHDEVLGQ